MSEEGKPSISTAEWTVMRVIWTHGPQKAREVIELLRGQVDWKPRTVKTLLNRLVKKAVLGFEEQGREYVYHALVEEDEIIRVETRAFLDRVFGGTLAPLVAHLADDGELSSDEIAELRQIIDAHESSKGGSC